MVLFSFTEKDDEPVNIVAIDDSELGDDLEEVSLELLEDVNEPSTNMIEPQSDVARCKVHNMSEPLSDNSEPEVDSMSKPSTDVPWPTHSFPTNDLPALGGPEQNVTAQMEDENLLLCVDFEQEVQMADLTQIRPIKSEKHVVSMECEEIPDNECTLFTDNTSMDDNVHLKACAIEQRGNQRLRDKKRFSCNLCDYKCRFQSILQHHLERHTSKKPFCCHVCNKSFGKKRYLRQHMVSHSETKHFECNICGYRCHFRQSLQKHLLGKHKGNHFPSKQDSTQLEHNSLFCNVCENKYSEEGDLKQHMLTHASVKPFACKICNYNTDCKCNLATHLASKKHTVEYTKYVSNQTGTKQFRCKICNYWCYYKHTLNLHLLTKRHIAAYKKSRSVQTSNTELHANENSLAVCDKVQARDEPFIKQDDFKALTDTTDSLFENVEANVIHANKKHFFCNTCNYETHYEEDLERHAATKHHRYLAKYPTINSNQAVNQDNEKKFCCGICNYSSNYKQNFKTHLASKLHGLRCATLGCKDNSTHHDDVHVEGNAPAPDLYDFLSVKLGNSDAHVDETLSHPEERVDQENCLKEEANGVCSRTFPQKSNFSEHLLQHTGKELLPWNVFQFKSSRIGESEKCFSCNVCNFKTSYKHGLMRHIGKVHPEQSKGAFCYYRTGSKVNFKAHLRSKEHIVSYAKFQANQAKTVLSGQNVRNNLCFTNTDNKPPFKFSIRGAQHYTRTHTKGKRWHCKLCSFDTKSKGLLKGHMIRHTDERPFCCNICDFKAKLNCHLVLHKKKHAAQKVFFCNTCTFKCTLEANFAKHVRTHRQQSTVSCNMCSFKCSRANKLENHMLTHSVGKGFSCDVCDYTFMTKTYLIIHYRTHTGEKPYSCNLCSYKSTTSSNVKVHVLRRHQAEGRKLKSFSCTVCEYKTESDNLFKVHMTKHINTNTPPTLESVRG